MSSLLVAQRLASRKVWGGWGLSDRADLLHDLESKPEHICPSSLYARNPASHEEWVFNSADIDAFQIDLGRAISPVKSTPTFFR